MALGNGSARHKTENSLRLIARSLQSTVEQNTEATLQKVQLALISTLTEMEEKPNRIM